ncbi:MULTISPECIES: DmsC/YnfH family molybdoenzyme membrane anchor subunit [Pasteurellaceae]|uniref:DmsC/YnfH family molybdoenzyme membrane anchor subunit n=1 Tax=Pasteurellaceae TaxID=712 RepID=UPI003565B9B1
MNGLVELPLIVFTVLAQSAVGAWLIFCVVLWRSQYADSRRIYRRQFVLLALLGVGFIASMLHLGSPLRAFNAFNRVGESMLSNEIAGGAAFFATAGLFWLLAIFDKLSPLVAKTWQILTALLGVVFMYMMANLYQIPTVPTWYTALTSWQFYLTAAVGGAALAYGLLALNPQPDPVLKGLPWLHLVALGLIAVVTVYQVFQLAHTQSSIQQALDLVPDFAYLTALRLLCLAVAAWLLFQRPQAVRLSTAVLLTLFAEGIGRSLFYALHMTSGMAVGG